MHPVVSAFPYKELRILLIYVDFLRSFLLPTTFAPARAPNSAQPNMGEARQSAPHNDVSGGGIVGVGEIACVTKSLSVSGHGKGSDFAKTDQFGLFSWASGGDRFLRPGWRNRQP